MGRKTAQINLDELARLALLNPSTSEIASYFGVSKKTIERRMKNAEFAQVIEDGRNNRKISLKRFQWQAASSGSVPMLIFLGKNELGQRDAPALENEGEHTTKIAGAVAAAVGTMQLMIKNESEDADGPVEST